MCNAIDTVFSCYTYCNQVLPKQEEEKEIDFISKNFWKNFNKYRKLNTAWQWKVKKQPELWRSSNQDAFWKSFQIK